MKLSGLSSVIRGSFLVVMLVIATGCSYKNAIKVDSIVYFGRYPQTALGENKPIMWRVVEVDDNKALLLAEKGLDAVPYHNTESADVTWKTSSIRQWLNQDFYNTAFNDSEKINIVMTVLKNPDRPEWHIKGCGYTEDRIFLLSSDEAAWYLRNDVDKALQPTPYVLKKGIPVVVTPVKSREIREVIWWVRERGCIHKPIRLNEGNPKSLSYPVTMFASGEKLSVSIPFYVVRPALWVDLNGADKILSVQ